MTDKGKAEKSEAPRVPRWVAGPAALRPAQPEAITDLRTVWSSPSGLTALVVALGGVSYAVVRYGAAAFYDPLGTQPEEIGGDRSQLLQQTLGTAALLAAYVIIYLGLAYAVCRLGWSATRAALARRQAAIPRWFLGLIAGAALILLGMAGLRLYAVALLLGLMLTWGRERVGLIGPFVVAFLASMALLGFFLVRAGEEAAALAQAGERSSLAIPGPWQTRLANIAPRGRTLGPLANLNRCVVVLGSNTRGVVAYASDVYGVRRLVTLGQDVVVQVLPDLERCEWPRRQDPAQLGLGDPRE